MFVGGLALVGLVFAVFAWLQAPNGTSGPARPTSVAALHHNGDIVLLTADGLTSINPDTDAEHPLVACPGPCAWFKDPVWSPDGTRLAYEIDSDSSGAFPPDLGIWVLDAATGRSHKLTRFPTDCKVPSSGGVTGSISWSADGSRLAFEQCGVWVMNVDGSHKTEVIKSGVDPALSPDGARIAFVEVGKSRASLYVVDTNGSNLTRLPTPGWPSHPTWSPDGSKIAYDLWYSVPNCPVQIWVIHADGSHPKMLIENHGCFVILGWSGPAWSPDGAKLAFVYPRARRGECLIVMDADGSHPRVLREGLSEDDRPAWRPVP